MKDDRYVIVCDESTRNGKFFSYFYGGAIVLESEYENISKILTMYADSKGLGEVKRTKVTPANLKNYIELLDLFFTFVEAGKIKARVMFSKNEDLECIPSSLNETYCKFYYLFIRYAFSLYYARTDISLRLIFDELPETKEACKKFKNYIRHNLNFAEVERGNRVNIKAEDIQEVDSKKHIILQCMDVIVGIVDSTVNTPDLNNLSNRGKARHELWKFIYKRITKLHGSFLITATTQPIYSHRGWLDPYKHFIYTKRKTPAIPT